MKLYYFDTSGRAETARVMFALGDIEFEDVRFDAGAWASQYKGKSPTGQSPFLELDNGDILCQSMAINVYAANLAGRWPADPLQQARHLEIIACWDDLWDALAPSFAIENLEARIAERQQLLKPGGDVHTCLEVIDDMLRKSKTLFYQGDSIGPADVCVFNVASQLATGHLDGLDNQTWHAVIRHFKHIQELRDRVAREPKLIAYYGPRAEKYKAFLPAES